MHWRLLYDALGRDSERDESTDSIWRFIGVRNVPNIDGDQALQQVTTGQSKK
jgi:hypothetical protein